MNTIQSNALLFLISVAVGACDPATLEHADAGYADGAAQHDLGEGSDSVTEDDSAADSLSIDVASGEAGPSPITAQFVAHRVSGVAPLSVHFDATATTHADGTLRPFHDLHYAWDFGDPSAGTWTHSGRDKNHEFGAVMGHVFESPGTYTVLLTVRDEMGNSATSQTTITVSAPGVHFADADIHCFSSDSNESGWDAICSRPGVNRHSGVSDFDAALSLCGFANGGRWCRFKGGDNYTADATLTHGTSVGPTMVSAWGTGKINVSAVGAFPAWSLGCNGRSADVRLLDVNWTNDASVPWSNNAPGVSYIALQNGCTRAGADDLLVLRNTFDGSGSAGNFVLSAGSQDHPETLYAFIVDNEAFNIDQNISTWGQVDRLFYSGNYFHHASKHGTRIHGPGWSVISHNRIERVNGPPSAGSACFTAVLTIHQDRTDGTHHLIIADNQFVDARGHIDLTVQGDVPIAGQAVCQHDLIFERNHSRRNTSVTGCPAFGTGLQSDFSDATFRNNILDQGGQGHAINVYNVGGVQSGLNCSGQWPGGVCCGGFQKRIRVLHDTVYNAEDTGTRHVHLVNLDPAEVMVANSVVYSTDAQPIWPAGVDGGNNVFIDNDNAAAPGPFVGPTPIAGPMQLRPSAAWSAPALIAAGRSVPVFVDFEGQPRGGQLDIGALRAP